MSASTTTPSRAPTLTLDFPSLFPSQRLVASHPARFKVLAAGRRWRKTSLAVLLCLQTALRGSRAWYVAPSYPMAGIGWQALRRLVRQIPGAELREMDRVARVPGDGEVQVRSADDPNSLRGFGLDGVVLDEAAFCKEEAWTEGLRPALTDRQGWALFCSTPNGYNWFHKLWQQAGEFEGWARWQFPSWDNPYLKPEEIELAKRQSHPVVFAQEWGAEFIELAGLKPFAADWIRYWDDRHDMDLDQLYICVGLDQAISQRDEACMSALVAVGQALRGPDRLTAYVLKAAQGHWTPYETVGKILNVVEELNPRKVRVEDVGWQGAIADMARREAALRGIRLPFIDMVKPERGNDKLRRALKVSPMVEAGYVLFGPGQRELVDALLSVPHDKTGWDFTDAFSLAVSGLPQTRAQTTPLEPPAHLESTLKRARSYAPQPPERGRGQQPLRIRPGMGFPMLPGGAYGREEAVRRGKKVASSYSNPFKRREKPSG